MRDYYKYYFKIGNLILHGGIINNLQRREIEHQNSRRWTSHVDRRLYWSNGHIYQIGSTVSKESALQWERDNGYGANQ